MYLEVQRDMVSVSKLQSLRFTWYFAAVELESTILRMVVVDAVHAVNVTLIGTLVGECRVIVVHVI